MFRNKKQPAPPKEAEIRAVLGDPEWLSGLQIKPDGDVILVIEAEPENSEAANHRKESAEDAVRAVQGVKSVKTVLTAQKDAAAPTNPTPKVETVAGGRTRVRKGARLSDQAVRQGQVPQKSQINPIAGISRILVVASAKGGVGKSTVSTNLAATFAKQGLKVGLLDADIYGPSIPTMLGTADQSPATNSDSKLVPSIAHGIASVSIGYLTDPDAPMIWRGPIVQSAINQMLNDVAWGTPEDPLDLLIIDTPPGTGEAQLTLAQRVPVDAAVLVTTPQEVALADVSRGAAMFRKTHIPILGLVETMSWFEDPAGQRHYLMGQDGGERMASALGLPLLGQIPMLTDIRSGGDEGVPAVLSSKAVKDVFFPIARDIALSLDALQTKPAPEIIFED